MPHQHAVTPRGVAPTDEYQATVEHLAADERRWEAEQRERRERREASQLKALNRPKSAKIVYLEIAANDRELTHAQFRFLALRTQAADSDLSNCFAGLSRVAEQLGVSKHRALNIEWELKRLGYLRTQEFQSDRGKSKQICSGVQFCLPARVVPGNSGNPWRGPARWDTRAFGRPKAPKRTARYNASGDADV